MQHIYDTYAFDAQLRFPTRIDTTTSYDEAIKLKNKLQEKFAFTIVSDNLRPALTYVLDSDDTWESWRLGLERASTWKPGVVKMDNQEKKFVDDYIEKVLDVHHQHSNPLHSPRANSNLHSTPSAIDPPHYQNFLELATPDFDAELERDVHLGLQWIETMCRLERFRNNPEAFVAALELQVRKYLDRAGKKDASLQEHKKALWYLKFMVAYEQNGCKPILVKDVEEILARE